MIGRVIISIYYLLLLLLSVQSILCHISSVIADIYFAFLPASHEALYSTLTYLGLTDLFLAPSVPLNCFFCITFLTAEISIWNYGGISS